MSCLTLTNAMPVLTQVSQANADQILDYRVKGTSSFVFSPDIAEAIYQLLQDSIISKVMDHSTEFYPMDSVN
jgi:guanine nucleotide-binding protein subunit alpha